MQLSVRPPYISACTHTSIKYILTHLDNTKSNNIFIKFLLFKNELTNAYLICLRSLKLEMNYILSKENTIIIIVILHIIRVILDGKPLKH